MRKYPFHWEYPFGEKGIHPRRMGRTSDETTNFLSVRSVFSFFLFHSKEENLPDINGSAWPLSRTKEPSGKKEHTVIPNMAHAHLFDGARLALRKKLKKLVIPGPLNSFTSLSQMFFILPSHPSWAWVGQGSESPFGPSIGQYWESILTNSSTWTWVFDSSSCEKLPSPDWSVCSYPYATEKDNFASCRVVR